jgi:hypothetical protein
VRCPALIAFSRALRSLLRHLGEASGDEYWRGFLRFFRVSRFRLSVAPLPLGHHFEDLAMRLAQVEGIAHQCDSVFPGSGKPALALLDQYRAMSGLTENSLLDAVREVSDGVASGSAALLVMEPALVTETEAVLRVDRRLRHIEIVVPPQLRGAACYNRLLVIGPAAWYPEFVFTSPRAHDIHLIHYDWAYDTWRPRTLLIGAIQGRRVLVAPALDAGDAGLTPEDLVEPGDLIPEPDWAAVIGRVERHEAADHDADEVEARLCALEGGAFTFLDAAEDANVLVIDLSGQSDEDEDDEPSVVSRVPVSAVVPGMFVILRTSGGGDYIIPVADRLLGQQAAHYRETQKNWKRQLRAIVVLHGMDVACRELSQLGAKLANEWNVRNWMHERSIRPHYNQDFAAILQLVGLSDQLERCFRAARAIETAHRSAGLRIRQVLLRRLLAADLRELERQGRMDLDLDEHGGGMLSALRIREMRAEACVVPASTLGQLLEGTDLT